MIREGVDLIERASALRLHRSQFKYHVILKTNLVTCLLNQLKIPAGTLGVQERDLLPRSMLAVIHDRQVSRVREHWLQQL